MVAKLETKCELRWQISNVRGNALHKLSHQLSTQNNWIVVDDLNVKGMLGNKEGDRCFRETSCGGGTVAVCGVDGSGRGRKTAVKPASAKQEVEA